MIELVPLQDLVRDRELFPRLEVDERHAARLADAIEAGVKLPPIVIGYIGGDRRKRIVDGFHRTRGFELARGKNAMVPCEVRHYATAAELLIDAIRLNAGHGLPLTDADKERCVALARKFGVENEMLATVMSVTATKVVSLGQSRVTRATRSTATHASAGRPSDDWRDDSGGRESVVADPLRAPSGLALVNMLHRHLIDRKIDLQDSNVRGSLKKLAGRIAESLRESEAA